MVPPAPADSAAEPVPFAAPAVAPPPLRPLVEAAPADLAPAAYARTARGLKVLFPVVLVLLATHLGEFWPFSIYPMFSRAGRPFTRSVVRELAPGEEYRAGAYAEPELPGKPFGVVPAGISQNDVANFVSKTAQWTPERAGGLQHLFGDHLRGDRRLLVFAARGELVGDRARVEFTPIIELTAAESIVVRPPARRQGASEERAP